MKLYVGTKSLLGEPMTLGVYNAYRGWVIPIDEDPETPGYHVEYLDGYQSWSPKRNFEESYNSQGYFTFGQAMFLLEGGNRMYRGGWNGKDMFIFKVKGSTFSVDREPLLSILGKGTRVKYHSHIDMRTADGTIVPWLCSQTDMAASDWFLI